MQKKSYIQNVYSIARKLNRLFPVSSPSITVHVFRNRISFLKAIHKKMAPDWLVAYVPPKSTSCIYVLGNKERITAKQVVSRRQVLLHELTHLYTNALNPNLPDWLKEGVSVYVAAQIFKSSISTEDWEKITQKGRPFKRVSWGFAAEHNGYNIAGLIVMFLVRRHGWKRFIAALSHTNTRRFSIRRTFLYFGEEFKRLMTDFKKQFVR